MQMELLKPTRFSFDPQLHFGAIGVVSVRWTFGRFWIEMRVMTKLSFPFTEEKIRAQKVGDEVLISGVELRQCP
jgi:hypothetical protein